MSFEDSKKTYKTGYQKPPKERQFKKGQSGNPNGRPRNPKKPKHESFRPLEDLILEEAYRPVRIREGDEFIELPAIQAVTRSLNHEAIKGNRQAQIAVANLVNSIEERRERDRLETYEAVLEYKRNWNRQFELCDRAGKPHPEVYPHPDDILVTPWSADVLYVGPMSKQADEVWKEKQANKAEFLEEIRLLEEEIEKNPRKRKSTKTRIEIYQRMCDRADALYPDESLRRSFGYDPAFYRERAGQDKETL